MLDVMKMYDKMKIDDDENDEAVDAAGYTGNFFRHFGQDR